MSAAAMTGIISSSATILLGVLGWITAHQKQLGRLLRDVEKLKAQSGPAATTPEALAELIGQAVTRASVIRPAHDDTSMNNRSRPGI